MFTEKTFINPKIEIKDSPIASKGMFAKEDISKDEIVIKWGGKFFTTEEAKRKNKNDFLIIQIDEDLWSVEKRGEYEDDYFINHSCDSNSWMTDGRTFVAKKNIKKGEEITVDYSLFENGNANVVLLTAEKELLEKIVCFPMSKRNIISIFLQWFRNGLIKVDPQFLNFSVPLRSMPRCALLVSLVGAYNKGGRPTITFTTTQ